MKNTIVYPQQILYYNSIPYLFKNVTTNANGDSCDTYNNMVLDPELADTAKGDYRLGKNSPCIDAGVNDSVTTSTDLDGNLRIWDGDGNGTATVDIGCYEYGADIMYDLGPDMYLCEGDTAKLDAGEGYQPYKWNNGLSSNRQLEVTKAGKYFVTVTNNRGDVGSDTIEIFFNPIPKIASLGKDTAFCTGGSKTFYPQAGFQHYLWNDTGTDRINTVTGSGNYFVKVTDKNGCSNYSDTIHVEVHKLPVAKLGQDTQICEGTHFRLDAGDFKTYNWNNGLAKSRLLEPTKTNHYFVEVTDSNNCSAFSDTVHVTVFPQPKPALGADTSFCEGESKLLRTGMPYHKYLWSTGSGADHIKVDKSGHFFVQVTDSNECSNYSDTVNITVYPLPKVKLGHDTAFCAGHSIKLDAGSGYALYEWNNKASHNQYLDVDETGYYYVYVKDKHHCSNYSDTIHVEVYPLPEVNLGHDTALCDGDVLKLDAGNGHETYNWNNGQSHKQYFEVTKAGSYHVYVISHHNCETYSDTLDVTYNPLPSVSLGPDQSIEDNEYLTLRAGPGFKAYRWHNNSTDSTLTIDASVEGIGTHTYYVTVTDNNHCQATDSIVVTIVKHSRIAGGDLSQKLEVYPNPTNGKFTVKIPEGISGLDVQVLNASGKLIREQKNIHKKQLEFDLTQQPKGLYLMKLIGSGDTAVIRILKY